MVDSSLFLGYYQVAMLSYFQPKYYQKKYNFISVSFPVPLHILSRDKMAVIDHIYSVHYIISMGKLMLPVFLKSKINFFSLIEKTIPHVYHSAYVETGYN